MRSVLTFVLSLFTLWPCYILFGHPKELVVDLGYQLNQGHTVVGLQARRQGQLHKLME